MLAAIIGALSGVAVSVPVQAEWDTGTEPPVTASIAAPAHPIKMEDDITIEVKVAVDQGRFRTSPFVTASRGVSFDVTDAKGMVVSPQELMPISPPAPPVQSRAMVVIGPGRPLVIPVKVPAKNLFPGPGSFKVRAIVRFMDTSSTVPRYLSSTSDQAIVKITM